MNERGIDYQPLKEEQHLEHIIHEFSSFVNGCQKRLVLESTKITIKSNFNKQLTSHCTDGDEVKGKRRYI